MFFLLKICQCGQKNLKINAKGTKEYKGVFRKICTKVTMFWGKKSLKPSYLESTFTKTKQNSKNFSTFLSGSFLLMDDQQSTYLKNLTQKKKKNRKKTPLLTQVRKEKKRKRKWTIFWCKRKEKKSPIFKSPNSANGFVKIMKDELWSDIMIIFFIFVKPSGCTF